MKRKGLLGYVGLSLLLIGLFGMGWRMLKEAEKDRKLAEATKVWMASDELKRYLGRWVSDEEKHRHYLEIAQQGQDTLTITSSIENSGEKDIHEVTIFSLEADRMDCLSLSGDNRYFFYFMNETQLTYHLGVNVAKHPKAEALSKPINYSREE